jgi:hypothetical protein
MRPSSPAAGDPSRVEPSGDLPKSATNPLLFPNPSDRRQLVGVLD